MLIFAFHEHDLKSDADVFEYEREVSKALANMHIPGLLNTYQLKGKKGERMNGYAVLWVFENMAAINNNFGTFDDPMWPSDWLHYENNVLAKYLTCHPDKIHFTDYGLIKSVTYKNEESLTTQQAAELLHVSRSYLVKLIDEKNIPSYKVGRYRRVYKSDVIAYKEKSLTERKKILQKLVDEAQELDLGY